MQDPRFNDVVVYQCGHKYHFQCLIKQIGDNKDWNCPLCSGRLYK